MSLHVGGRGPGHLVRTGAFYPSALAALDFQLQEYRTGSGSYYIRDLSALTGWSFTRASTKTALDGVGNVVSFASGVPAITDLGLLIEAAGTNLATYSQDLTQASAWTPSNVTLATGQTAPDRTSTATTLNGTGSFPLVQRAAIAYTAAPYVISIFVRKGTGTFALSFSQVGSADEASWNLATGATLSQGANISSMGFIDCGAFWRLWMVSTRTATAQTPRVWAGYPTNVSPTVWGYDIKQDAAVSSYIPTTSAAVTRAADALTLTYSGSPTTATVTYGTNSTASPSATSPLNLGSSSGGAWVGSYVKTVVVK